MEFGYFSMPSHPPERGLKAGHDWDLQTLRWLDELGYLRSLDRRAPHRAVGAASGTGPAGRPGAVADEAAAHRPRRLPAAVSPPGGTGEPRGDAGSSVRGPADVRRRGVRPAERLGDVQCRRNVGGEPGDDPRGAGHHPAAVERRAVVSVPRQVLERRQARNDVRLPEAAHQAVAEAASADRRGRAVEEFRHAEDGRRARLPAAEPEPQSGLCGNALGRGRGRRETHRPHAAPAGLAHGARGVRCGNRRRSACACRSAA